MTVKQVLRECALFSALNDDELMLIASSTEEKQYDAGATIFQAGDSASELLVIEEGKVAVQMTLLQEQEHLARKVTIDVTGKNEVLGWSAIVEPYTYTLTAVCLQKVLVISINGLEIRQLLQDNHKIGYQVLKGLIKIVASRLNETRQVLVSERLLAPESE